MVILVCIVCAFLCRNVVQRSALQRRPHQECHRPPPAPLRWERWIHCLALRRELTNGRNAQTPTAVNWMISRLQNGIFMRKWYRHKIKMLPSSSDTWSQNATFVPAGSITLTVPVALEAICRSWSRANTQKETAKKQRKKKEFFVKRKKSTLALNFLFHLVCALFSVYLGDLRFKRASQECRRASKAKD